MRGIPWKNEDCVLADWDTSKNAKNSRQFGLDVWDALSKLHHKSRQKQSRARGLYLPSVISVVGRLLAEARQIPIVSPTCSRLPLPSCMFLGLYAKVSKTFPRVSSHPEPLIPSEVDSP